MKKVYLIVSIDTECDKSHNWEVKQPLSFQNIFDQEKTLFPIFNKYSIKPTYLLSPEVLNDDKSIDFFKIKKRKIELGTHLHSEFIQPFEDMNSIYTKEVQSDLDADIEYKKLKNLTHIFREKLGYQPLAFRAGRFGVSEKTLNYLKLLGYKVDSSYLPYKHLKFKRSTVNGWKVNLIPFYKNEILEIPVTHFSKNYIQLPSYIRGGLCNSNSFQSRLLRKIYGTRKSSWLRPLRHGKFELTKIADVTVHQIYNKEDYAVLNIMFHSNELTPGCSPYCATNSDVDRYVEELDFLFKHLHSNYNLCSIGLGEICNYISQN